MITLTTTRFYARQADTVERGLLKVRAAKRGNAPALIHDMLVRQVKDDFRVLHNMRLSALHAEDN